MGRFDLSTVLREGPILYCLYCFLDVLVPKGQVLCYLIAVAVAVFILDERPSSRAEQPLPVVVNLRTGQASQKQLCEQFLHAHDLALSNISTFFLGRSDLQNLVRTTLRPSHVVQVAVRLNDGTIVAQPLPVQRRASGGTFEVVINIETEGQGHCITYTAWDSSRCTLTGRVLIDNLCFVPRFNHDSVATIDEIYYQYFV
jgi:hypothetical protein